MRLVLLFIILLFSATAVLAVEPDEVLKDQVLETRAMELSRGLRCLVCQGESIDESNAPLAKDIRLLVRERLKAGDSNGEVLNYLRDRYGDFILFEPPFNIKTLFLWLLPLGVFLAGIWVVGSFVFKEQVKNFKINKQNKPEKTISRRKK